MSNPNPTLLVDLTLTQFAQKLATSDAAPGGGSAAALAGALGAGLAEMVAGLTVGREKYAAAQAAMSDVLAQSGRLRRQLLALVDADTAAYDQVMAAYGLPKGTPEEKQARTAAIQEGLKHASDIPASVAEACVQVLNLAAMAAEQGNPNAGSDAAVAALLAHAGLHGAVRNVRINLEGIKDAQFNTAAEARVAGLLRQGDAALRRVTGE